LCKQIYKKETTIRSIAKVKAGNRIFNDFLSPRPERLIRPDMVRERIFGRRKKRRPPSRQPLEVQGRWYAQAHQLRTAPANVRMQVRREVALAELQVQ
jgi:hypothetical protein